MQNLVAKFSIILLVLISAGCEKNDRSPDPLIVATYEGGQISRKYVEDRISLLIQNVDADITNEIRNKAFYKTLIQSAVVDQMVKTKIEEKKLDKKDNVKHAMKHISEELNINELHSRAHDNKKNKVSEIDIKTYYEKNRASFEEKPLNEMKEYIREILQEKQEKEYFKNYLADLKKNAVIIREDRLLDIPAPSRTDLEIHYDKNREKYGAPAKSFSEVQDQILTELKKQNEQDWFEQKKNRTLFTIHGKRHTVGEFYEEFKELPFYEQEKYQTYSAKVELLNRLIERLLIVEDTYDQMLDKETEDEVSHVKEDVLKQLLHQEEVDDKLEITEEEVETYYEKHKKNFKNPAQVKISYIRVGSGQTPEEDKRAEKKINQAYKLIFPGFFKAGMSFEEVALKVSEDPETAKNGGELDKWISEGENIIEEIASHGFHENVMDLKPNEVSTPFLFNGSWYIVKVRERKPPEMMTYEETQGYIREALYQQKHESLTYNMSKTLLKQANLVIYDEVIESMLNKVK